jgi:outer membrane protein TolC
MFFLIFKHLKLKMALQVKKVAFTVALCGMALLVFGQVLTMEQAVQAALKHHPQIQAAALTTESKKLGERAARILPNPEITAESPTGEFYAVGFLQSFDFPTVYKNRKKVAQAETELARVAQKMSESELRYAVRTQFLELQAAEMELKLARRQDSIFQKMGQAATRQFAAGEIDLLQKTIAEAEAGTSKQALLSAQRTADNLRLQLRIWTGLPELQQVEPLQSVLSQMPEGAENPAVLYERQAAAVAQRQIAVARSQALPNFSLGYLNQGPRPTPIEYRLRASVGIPLWVGQNRATRQSAETAARAAESRAVAVAQNVTVETLSLHTSIENALAQVEYFQKEGLLRSRTLIETATRLRGAGQVDYTVSLRTIAGALALEKEYAAQLKLLHAARIRLQYLAGL